MEKNAGEWTGRVKISKEEITGGKRGMYGYILTYSRLDRTLTSASAAPHRWVMLRSEEKANNKKERFGVESALN